MNQYIINLSAVRSNIEAIKKKLGDTTEIMAIIKANAYGSDAVVMAKFLASCGIRKYGLSTINEGETLRRANVNQDLFILHASPDEANKVMEWNLEIGISNDDYLQAFGEIATRNQKTISIHLLVDTGMGRFGCRPEQTLELAHAINSHSYLKLEGLHTHLPSAEDPDDDVFTLQQIQTFDRLIATLREANIHPRWIHVANSAAAARFALPQYNMARIGLALFGLHTSTAVQQALPLTPAVSLASHIVEINHHRQGDNISYGRKYQIEKEEQRIAILPIGYHDGIHRCYSGRGSVLIRGKQAPMVGAICMDYMMVDITNIPNATIGNRALLFGQDEHGHYLCPSTLTSQANTIVHELISCLGPRIQRCFIPN